MLRRAEKALQAASSRGVGKTVCYGDQEKQVQLAAPQTFRISAANNTQSLTKSPRSLLEVHDDHSAFMQMAQGSIERAKRNENAVALLKIGISSWDVLQEGLGEQLTISLLRAVQSHVELEIREHDRAILLPQTGELFVQLSDLEQADDVTWIAKRLQHRLSAPMKVGEQTVYVVCKIGAALYPDDGQDASGLARFAGVALQRAKADKAIEGLKYYTADMTQASYRNLQIESGARAALQNDEFELYFQPIVDTKTGAVKAAEALLRCTSAQLSDVRIDQIIAVAERTSLSAEIDLWVIDTALKQMGNWDRSGLKLPKISINLSANQLINQNLMERIRSKIDSVPFSASRIQIEITETALLSDIELAAKALKGLQQLGVHIALDDFGTGQASLAYLQRLHPDVIKIDRSFVSGANRNHASATMVGAMTVMAHCLGLEVVAEGVETDAELEFLQEVRCDYIQGYLISKPLPAAIMGQWLGKFVGEKSASEANLRRQINSPQIASGSR